MAHFCLFIASTSICNGHVSKYTLVYVSLFNNLFVDAKWWPSSL